MGKRTRSESNDYECIAKKFKKLERKLLRARRKQRDRQPRTPRQRSPSSSSDSSSSSSSSSSASSRPRSPRASCSSPLEPYNNEDVPAIEYTGAAAPGQPPPRSTAPGQRSPGATTESAQPSGTGAAAPAQPKASTSRAADVRQHSDQVGSASPTPRPEQQPVVDPPEVPELDEEILKILGDDPSQAKIYGKEIRPDLAVRFQHIATVGLSKESRKELLQKYLPPANSILIDAPTLNPEIRAAVHEHVFKRDKSIEIRQKQVASAISCIGESLTLLLSEQPKNTTVIQLLMDASKIICDCQNAESLVRRSFILHNLKKGLKEEIQTTGIDKYLFSQDLADKLKAAKAINKSGDDLKITPSPLPQQPKKNVKPPARNLNWRGPPQIQRPKGTQRTREPAQKNRRYNSSRQSSRPASTRNNRR